MSSCGLIGEAGASTELEDSTMASDPGEAGGDGDLRNLLAMMTVHVVMLEQEGVFVEDVRSANGDFCRNLAHGLGGEVDEV